MLNAYLLINEAIVYVLMITYTYIYTETEQFNYDIREL